MNQKLRREAEEIMRYAIGRVLPDGAVARVLEECDLSGRVYLAAVGKAAWQMANAAVQHLQVPIAGGVAVTKYGHVRGDIPGVRCFEGGHPIPDENGLAGTQAILDMTADLTEEDCVLFLVSGGGSALFEKPLVPLSVLQELSGQLLAVGASVTEINTLRKRLSAVKGGHFAKWCEPARIEAVILSDVLGDPLDMIASGPAAQDPTTCADALAIVEKYRLNVTEEVLSCLRRETPRELPPVSSHVIGSVGQLCRAAAEKCRELGYEACILTDRMCCEAREAGSYLASLAGGGSAEREGNHTGESILSAGERLHTGESTLSAGERLHIGESTLSAGERLFTGGSTLATGERLLASGSVLSAGERYFTGGSLPTAGEEHLTSESISVTGERHLTSESPSAAGEKLPPAKIFPTSGKRAYIAGGECVVHLRGDGLGGRNQELALAAAEGLAGNLHAAVFSVGSDGTDGPTDAAGGYVDGESLAAMEAKGIRMQDALARNDSYRALEAVGGLLKTGPTGTNVNDFAVVLIDA